MSLRVVGAGLGRTGTLSLKLALERLIGGRCYHMMEVFQTNDFDTWKRAGDGEAMDWKKVFAGYTATVDWPSTAFWQSICHTFPDAWVVLSTRENAEAWYESAMATIFANRDPANPSPVGKMMRGILSATFTPDIDNRAAAIAAYDRHNAHVRATAPRGKLIDWKPGDGWAPLCEALRVPVPSEPFPHVNTTAEFRRRVTSLPGGRAAAGEPDEQ